jgi:lysophospholipase L1-like esterase
VLSTAAIAALILVGAGPADAAVPLPTSMAALGDSISQGTDSCGYKDCPANSWSTGTSASVNSHASRLRAAGATGLVANNDSVAGVKAAALLGQAQKAVSQNVGYVTIQIGANDACTSTVAGMTPVATYEAQVSQAVSLIATSLPTAKIYVTSIPNLKTMWNLSKGKVGARLIWSLGKVCQSMLANPTSTATADNLRRDAVQQRVTDYNAALARVCLSVGSNCTFDGNVVATYAFTASQISTYDYFHPSVAGQAKLAEITWAKSPYIG